MQRIDAPPTGGCCGDEDKVFGIDRHPLLLPRRTGQRLPNIDKAALELFVRARCVGCPRRALIRYQKSVSTKEHEGIPFTSVITGERRGPGEGGITGDDGHVNKVVGGFGRREERSKSGRWVTGWVESRSI